VSDRAVLALAAAVCAGAQLATPLPVWIGAVAALVAVVGRRSWLLVLAGGLLAATFAASAWAGLVPPASATVEGVAVLVGDPVSIHGAVRVDLRLGHRRVEAWSRGPAASALRSRLAGEQVRIRGRLRPAPLAVRDRLAVRHIATRLDVAAVGAWASGNLASRTANGLRRTLVRGATGLDTDGRSLLLGVVLGDDREQRPELAAQFRASGLSHLLVVSGENVAFVLALAGPMLRRLGLRARWVATLALLAFFGLLTRWEPSVLRAGAMAALACTAVAIGRPSARVRLLALAIAGVVLVDPLLVHSLGFRLSVGATAGIALLAGPLGRRVPGPRWLVEPLVVTIAAQVGVAPIAIPAFGGLPVAALPANLLAVPAAAPLTAWGLTGGVLAGVAGPPFDRWLHLPTRVLARWLVLVAGWCAPLPLGQVRAPQALALAVLVTILVIRGRGWRRRRPRLGSGRWSWRSDRTASTSARGPS
jgi:competence protein ComEC